MDTWLTGLLSDGSMTICNLDSTAPGSITTVAATETTPRHIEIQAQAVTTETGASGKVVVYSPEAYTDNEKGLEVPQGWSIVNWVYDGVEEEITYTIEALTAKAEYHFDDSTVTLLNSAFTTPNGKVVGTIPGDPATEYDITGNITNGSIVGASKIAEYSSATVTVVAQAGYDIPSEVTVTGVSSYEYENGVITLNNPSDDVTITGECVALVEALLGEPIKGMTVNPIDMTDIVSTFGNNYICLMGCSESGYYPRIEWTNHFEAERPYRLVIKSGDERLDASNNRAYKTFVFFAEEEMYEQNVDARIPAGWSIARFTNWDYSESKAVYDIQPLTTCVTMSFVPNNWVTMDIIDAKFAPMNGEAIGVEYFDLEKFSRGETATAVKFDVSVLNVPLAQFEDSLLDAYIRESSSGDGQFLYAGKIPITSTTISAGDINTSFSGWNGVLLGKDDGNGGIAAIQDGDTLTEVMFNTNLNVSDIYALFGQDGAYWLIDGLVKIDITANTDIVITLCKTTFTPTVDVYNALDPSYPGWRVPSRKKGATRSSGWYNYGSPRLFLGSEGVTADVVAGLQFRKEDDDYQIYDTKSNVVVYSFTNGFNTEVVTDGVYAFGETRSLDFVSAYQGWNGIFIGKNT